jgi:predicted HD superfamily hydrolase involved in NAD metabolism
VNELNITSQSLTGVLSEDMTAFLIDRGCPKTAEHSRRVVAEARRLAQRFGEDQDRAEQAGWLHDISAVFPAGQRLEAARELGVEVLPEEAAYPMILHQKLSVVVARRVFGVTDPGVLSAIGCHTTLKAGASRLDLVVFVADKLEWDSPDAPPYRQAVLAGLECSLERGAFAYLDYLWKQRQSLPVLHPWMVAAYHELE